LTKRFIGVAVMVLACVVAAGAAPPASLTTLRAVHALTNAEASHELPAAFEATVTYFPGYDNLLFVQDGDEAIFVQATTDAKLVLGDRVLIKGTTQSSFRPLVESNDITVLRHGNLPKPVPATFDELIRAQYDCMRVTVRAVIRTANFGTYSDARVIYLQMLTDGGYIDTIVDSNDENAPQGLLDAEVEVTGAAGGKFDGKMQQTGVMLHVSPLANVKILKRAGASPWSLPLTPLDKILAGYHVRDLSQRLRARGTITYYRPGLAVVLQDGAKSLWIDTPMRSPLQIGDVADATGFPETHNGFLVMTHGEIEDSHVQAPVTPQPVTWSQLATWGDNMRDVHIYDLVSIEGQVVTEVRESGQDEYVLNSNGHMFSAIYRHSDRTSLIPLPPMKQIPLGAMARVSGIGIPENADLFNDQVPFDILLRSFDDITVVARPPWLDVRHLMWIIGLLLALVTTVGTASWARERKSSRQIGTLAYVEQRRARILEAINHSKPLGEILERVTELVSVRLNGAPCWCQVADGATLGNRPVKLSSSSLRTVEHPIASRTGSTLGSVFAAFDARTKGDLEETTALAMAAELATLAIETSHLYSDLVHRSEFDLLTDVQNRFVMEKKLAAMIHAARQSAGIFGLIYIDLNQFKLVNDVHGHVVGDLYLQEVAQRMKRQLRPGDTLARLGGDEFAVLVPVVHSRAEVEEIAARLEFCFHEPFVRDECVIHGSASVGIALYPEDAETVETLLSTADAKMYAAKYTRMGKSREGEALDEDDLVKKDRS
jgi:diguanylate cyclase (GGDEF)-like protein